MWCVSGKVNIHSQNCSVMVFIGLDRCNCERFPKSLVDLKIKSILEQAKEDKNIDKKTE